MAIFGIHNFDENTPINDSNMFHQFDNLEGMIVATTIHGSPSLPQWIRTGSNISPSTYSNLPNTKRNPG